jgi:hypothetical protein
MKVFALALKRLLVLALLLVLPWPVLAESDGDKPTLDELLAWLEISTATAQADRVLLQSLARYPALSVSDRQAALAALTKRAGSDVLTRAVKAYIRQHGQAYLAPAGRLYDHPLVRRASNFEAALALSNASLRFHQYQQQLADNPPNSQRLALAKRIDQVLHSSQLAALMQTELDMIVDAWFQQTSQIPTEELLRQRQAYMAPMSEALYLYSYRFLKDAELQQFVELLEAGAIRELTALAVIGLQQTLVEARAPGQ